MESPKLGSMPTDTDVRDAIHIAIYPATAGRVLYPSQVVEIRNGVAHPSQTSTSGVGIVDPFLKHTVLAGTKVWICLYPGSITSLRHDWTHPDINNELLSEEDVKAVSERWMRNYSDSTGISYSDLLSRFAGDNEGWLPVEEFWYHYSVITGDKDPTHYFSCAC